MLITELFCIQTVSVECEIRYDYVLDGNCIDTALINNEWATSEEIVELDDNGKQGLLMEKLGTYYSSDVHSSLDLSMREVSGDKGSLCGLAAVYQAAIQTILTKSEMKQMSFDGVKEMLGEKVSMDTTTTKATFDKDFLELYFQGN